MLVPPWPPALTTLLACTALFVCVRAHIKVECNGFDEEWGECPDMMPCNECVPRDCVFSDWGDWYDMGGCSQVNFRSRQIAVVHNECGAPCQGAKIESKEVIKPHCQAIVANCSFGDWADWSDCDPGASQSFRSRNRVKDSANGGTPCNGALKETRECANSTTVADCIFGQWHDWTDCSASCGVGQHTRMRQIQQHAVFPGKACQGEVQEYADCLVAPCPNQDCEVSPWADWEACLDLKRQTYRTRSVLKAALGQGAACTNSIQETRACPIPPPENCILGDWEPWSLCGVSCGSGQITRVRKVVAGPKFGGTCDEAALNETQACNTEQCPKMAADCVLSDWTQWDVCSANCGVGSQQRTRTIAKPADEDGEACVGSLTELKACRGLACKGNQDCKWSEWHDWSACTCSCGGGSMHRERAVDVPPRFEGKACENLTKSEVAACNTQPCEHNCQDAVWGDWSKWTICSATCTSGFQSRTREVAQEANSCGKPLNGTRIEYRTCVGLPDCVPSQDCALSDWGEWSTCSATCYGNRERNRGIEVFAKGDGRACDLSTMRQVEACEPGVNETLPLACGRPSPPVDCVLGDWCAWTPCSRTCGGGQQTMTRKIATYPDSKGKPCEGELIRIRGCSSQQCTVDKCMDCLWSDWADWGDCSHCGGQRYRFRHIAQMPNHCGLPCDLQSAKEIGNCTSHCADTSTCTWSDWSATTGCQANTCGGSAVRTRQMGWSQTPTAENGLFEAGPNALCTGTQFFTATCDRSACKPVCQPQDCVFGDWGEWERPTCLGLCTRARVISQHNNECGIPCSGQLEETKRCEADCHRVMNCTFSDWGPWTPCLHPRAQMRRTRNIKQYPMNGGDSCQGPLAETKACGTVEPEPCVFSDWTSWVTCDKSCGGGLTRRSRVIVSQARVGGALCEGSLADLKACNTQLCPDELAVDCQESDWSAWSECDTKNQKIRERVIVKYSAGAGKPCDGALKETETCGLARVDCQVSDWTPWDECDKTCGGGQQQRHRQVHEYPHGGGTACPEDLVSQRGCNTQSCDEPNCAMSAWSEWSNCSNYCGSGQTTRTRTIARPRSGTGKSCSGIMEMTQACVTNTVCHYKECKWSDWTAWSACTCSCGGGQMNRVRHITQMPDPGARACATNEKEQIAECNTQKCEGHVPVDGTWSDWSEWAPCSATCQSGVTFRLRKVATMASQSGTPPAGLDRESKFCNVDVPCTQDIDCLFTPWNEWSGCSKTCSGLKRRERRISQFGTGNGKYCEGALKETWPCNPAPQAPAPIGCQAEQPVDCQLGLWAPWSACTRTCGVGQHHRSRAVSVEPKFGGKVCEGALGEVKPCSNQPCVGPAPVDCMYGDWQDWNACSKCGGQRKRFRSIVQLPLNGGANCEKFDSEEVSNCTSPCEVRGYCSWTDWAPWGECTTSCGNGRRTRQRKLALVPSNESLPVPKAELLEKYMELSSHAESLDTQGRQDLFVAFGAGFSGLGVLLVGFRVFVQFRAGSAATQRTLEYVSGERPNEDAQSNLIDRAGVQEA